MNPTHRAITGALAIALCMVGIQALDEHDAAATERALAADVRAAQAHAAAERREWQARVSVCHRAFGPQTVPVEDQDGFFRCQGRRGELADPTKPTPHATQVAQR